MDVLEQQQHGRVAAEPLEQRQQRLEQPALAGAVLLVGGLAGRRAAELGQELAERVARRRRAGRPRARRRRARSGAARRRAARRGSARRRARGSGRAGSARRARPRAPRTRPAAGSCRCRTRRRRTRRPGWPPAARSTRGLEDRRARRRARRTWRRSGAAPPPSILRARAGREGPSQRRPLGNGRRRKDGRPAWGSRAVGRVSGREGERRPGDRGGSGTPTPAQRGWGCPALERGSRGTARSRAAGRRAGEAAAGARPAASAWRVRDALVGDDQVERAVHGGDLSGSGSVGT